MPCPPWVRCNTHKNPAAFLLRSFPAPRPQNRPHQTKPNQWIKLIDRKQLHRPHLVHIRRECHRPHKSNPQKYPQRRPARRRIGTSPNANLRQNKRNQQIQNKRNDVRQNWIQALRLSAVICSNAIHEFSKQAAYHTAPSIQYARAETNTAA